MIERPGNRLKKGNQLTQVSFDSLLAFLGTDRESAAQAYLDLRRSLFTFFAVRNAPDPDELADEVFNRVARRLSEGVEITTEQPASFFYAVARNVWRERLARGQSIMPLPEFESPALRLRVTPHDDLMAASVDREIEARHHALQACLARLPEAEREVLMNYYQFDGGAKIEMRKELAERLQVSGNNLRQKIARLKLRLNECVKKTLRAERGRSAEK